ncbi:hypothetical protein A4D02_32995 [Niastella koreensis]|uniref:HEAT domain containing protein n=2 Tax=Niastella koreensis TaxID=354356 RepID=G8THL1_NIAKG|nr:HEAT repeat domain-containing protein [Niastella koreensis]AEV97439.1 HEAT domain containing protein [Niastella koreensis GR20-10]OQP45479.1 hypothetical protein A4D02_32995 [Niastella koreensis]
MNKSDNAEQMLLLSNQFRRFGSCIPMILFFIFTVTFHAKAQEKQIVKSYPSLVSDTIDYSLSRLIEFTKSKDERLRQFAIMRLAEQKDMSDEILSLIIGAFEDKSPKVQFQAIADLIRLGSPATKMLLRELSNKNVIGQYDYSSAALNGWRSVKITPADFAFTALRYARSTDVDALLNAYKTSPPIILQILKSVPIEPTDKLYEALAGKDVRLSVAIAGLFGKMGAESPDKVLPVLAAMVIQGNEEKRTAAATALSKIPGRGYIQLRNCLRFGNADVKAAVLQVYPLEADSASNILQQYLKNSTGDIQFVVLSRLGVTDSRYNYYDEDYPEHEGNPTVYSVFINNLSPLTIEEVIDALKSKAPLVRLAAITAASSIAQMRKEYSQRIVDALLTMLSDTDEKVKACTIREMAKLAEKNIVAGSPIALSVIFGQFNHPDKDQLEYLLAIAAKTKAAEPSENFIVELIELACTQRNSSDEIAVVFKSKPGWTDKGARIILDKYMDTALVRDQLFYLILSMGPGGSNYIELLQRFLSNEKEWKRTRAAIKLFGAGIRSDEVMAVLEKASRHFEGYAGWSGDAADSLAKADPNRLISIINDPTLSKRTRSALVYYPLSGIANENEKAADIILSLAVDNTESKGQEDAVWSTRSLKDHPEKTRRALEKAFSNGKTEVRYAVVYSWHDLNLKPGDFIDQVIKDTSPEVRKLVFELMDSMPVTDPRKLSITKKMLEDTDEYVREEALRFANKLGPGSIAIFESWLNSGRPLEYSFFDNIKSLAPFNKSTITSLQARKINASSETKALIDRTLEMTSDKTFVNVPDLYKQLADTNEIESRSAAETLIKLNENPWEHQGLIAYTIAEVQVEGKVKKFFGTALDMLHPPGMMLMSGSIPSLPSFPWPPPAGYRDILVPFNLFKQESVTTLGGIYNSITAALNSCDHNFEYGLFGGVPNGFALLARMEHVEEDGTPLPGKARWTTTGSSNSGLLSLFGDIWFEKPGYFRMIAFVVTDDLNWIPNPNSALPDVSGGSRFIPRELEKTVITNQQIIALVYTLERKDKGKFTVWSNGISSARVHLEKAGVWTRLK